MQQGFFAVQQTCPRCKGRGQVISQPCDSCLGQGRLRKKEDALGQSSRPASIRAIAFVLPAKARQAETAVRRAICTWRSAFASTRFSSATAAISRARCPISFATATLGGDVEVPTLGGHVDLKVPGETQSGRVFRLREKGVKPVRGGPTGDLFCRVVVETPVNLTEEQKELLRKFEDSMHASSRNHSPRERSWLDGVKRFFDTIRS